MTQRWHHQEIDSVLEELNSSPWGISSNEALSRRRQFGPNELRERNRRSPVGMFLSQFTDFMILVLIAAALVSAAIGEHSDTLAIIVILVLNAVLGFTQEYRAERALAALKRMTTRQALVLRDRKPMKLPTSELVPGDIVLVESGNMIPADLRVIEAVHLKVEEAALTGESVPTDKQSVALPEGTLSLGDRKNMLFKGTFVASGRGTGVVTATGMNTELGRIAALIQDQQEGKTPLQKRLAHFGKRISSAILAICIIIFIGGLLRGEPAINILLLALSLAVAAIPEALPAVVTISLALGARKMVKQNALIRKLSAVETLGSITTICTDKTGTLTLNRMTVEEAWCDGRADGRRMDPVHLPQQLFLTALALSNDARVESAGKILGDPTEAALFSLARENGFHKEKLEGSHPRLAELPFDSERKLMTTFHEMTSPGITGRFVSFTKGAVEVVIARSSRVLTSEGIQELKRNEIQGISDRMATEGLRVMAIGLRSWDRLPDTRSSDNVESELTLLGLTGMMDPPRPEAKAAVTECKRAGITPVLITGDHPLTAYAIAKRIGIIESDSPKAIMTGTELEALSIEELEQRVESIRVYARVVPEQKLKIVRALQDRGHFVAMTGDGVNDAPALKRADIGVAMGDIGTDVAKEASSMVLLDDNFSTVVKAVREGRKIYDNIRKFIKYLLSTNSGEIWTLFLAPFLGLPLPLQPIHILWINLITDALPALALSLEPAEKDVMDRPPRPPHEGLLAHRLGLHAIWVGLLMAAVVLGLQSWMIHVEDTHWQTMVFTVLCFLQLGHVMAIRSERQSLFQQGLGSNKVLLATVVLTGALQSLTIYVPALQPVFKTQSLPFPDLLIVLALSTTLFFAVEMEKYWKRRH